MATSPCKPARSTTLAKATKIHDGLPASQMTEPTSSHVQTQRKTQKSTSLTQSKTCANDLADEPERPGAQGHAQRQLRAAPRDQVGHGAVDAGDGLVVLDIPLLFEGRISGRGSGALMDYDGTVVVWVRIRGPA